jgi:hypothetical protein
MVQITTFQSGSVQSAVSTSGAISDISGQLTNLQLVQESQANQINEIVSGGIGTQGLSGFQGIAGIQGLNGFQGIAGTGTQGLDGLQGIIGTQGLNGFQGIAGGSNEYYGATGTVSIGTGITGTSPTYASLKPLFMTPLFEGTSYKVINFDVSSEYTDFYTTPTGKKALLFSYHTNNVSGSTATTYMALKISSTYYRIDGSPVSTATSNTATRTGTFPYIFTAGQTASFVCSQTSNVRVIVFYCEFDESVPIFSAIKYSNWEIGNNTLYTNSTYNGLVSFQLSGIASQPFILTNFSGGSVTYNIYNVPSSGSTTSLYLTTTVTLSTGTSALSAANSYVALNSSLIVNTTSSADTQVVYCTFVGFT